MSNAKANMLGTVTHAIERKLRASGEGFLSRCGKAARHAATDSARSAVTCRRCLASLAKRDRAFQRKARGWFGFERLTSAERVGRKFFAEGEAARAIAREEGLV